jgi:DNA-binding PadR family transcriptional regulator
MYTPTKYAVLEAIARRARTPKEISSHTGLSSEEVLEVLNQLELEGLVERRLSGLLFKKEVYELTSRAWARLDEWRERARIDLERVEKLRRTGNEGEAEEILAAYLPVLPFLLTLEIFSFLALSDVMASIEASDINNTGLDGESEIF